MGHMVKYPDRRDGSTLFDFYGNIIPAGSTGLLFTAKGDIPVGTGPGAGVMQPIGTAGQVLTVDLTQADGVKWAPASSVGAITSVSAGDASLVISPTTGAVVAEAGTLDQIANLHPPAANWSNNSKKITSLAAPSATGDAVSQGHVLAPLETEFTAAGQLIAGTGAGTGELFPLGAAGQVMAVGGSDPSGLLWQTPQPGVGIIWVAGQWYSCHANTGGVGVAQVQNTGYAAPFLVGRTHTFAAMGIAVQTGVGGTTARLGIYADNGSNYPGALVLDAGAVSTAVATTVTVAISQSLPPGIYWLVMVPLGAAGAVQNACWGIGSAVQRPTTQLAVLGFSGANGTQPNIGYSLAALTTGGLPNPFGAGATLLSSAVSTAIPHIMLQA